MKHKLMIKTHKVTGLKYLCYTRKKDHISYTGSGVDWLQHLLENGFEYDTELILVTENFEEFKQKAISLSYEYNVVESKEWANRKIEEGDGGDTVSNKKWITNGVVDKYIMKGLELPEGWKYGRSNCIFNDSNKQKEFSLLADFEKRGDSIKKAWDEGRVIRDHSKCGHKGENNPSKRKEVREKIKSWQLNREPGYCEICNKWFKNLEVHLSRSIIHNERTNKSRKV